MLDSLNQGVGRSRDAKTAQDRFVVLDESGSLGVNDNVAHVTGFSAATTVTLPQVAEAAGRVYAVKILDDASTNSITIQDNDESRSWSDLTCSNAAGGSVLLFSDGESWWILASTNVS